MKHIEVKSTHQLLIELLNHCVQQKVDIYHVHYGLNKNMVILEKAVEEINKGVSQELKDIEKDIFSLGEKNKEIEKELTQQELFNFGKQFLNSEQQDRYNVLYDQYLIDMEEENDIQLYYLNPDKIEGIKIEYPFYLILKKFLPTE